jgi:hypothetical protein
MNLPHVWASMNFRLLLTAFILCIPNNSQSQDNCARCDCSDYPLTESFCVKCCFTQKGTVTSTSQSSVTIAPAPSPAQPKPPAKRFKISSHTKIEKPLEIGKDATIYYHEVDGENVATKIDLTDYIQGQLAPDSLPAPADNYCVKSSASHHLPADAAKVLLGASGSIALSYPYVALQINRADIITLQRTGQGMLVSANLYDSQGKLAAQIIDNHFFVKVRPAFRLDRSDPHSLRILDGDATLVDIQFMNPTTLRVLGTLYGPLGTHLDVSQDVMKVNGCGYMVGVCTAGADVGMSIQ